MRNAQAMDPQKDFDSPKQDAPKTKRPRPKSALEEIGVR
jgi:hypothetical protein